MKLPLFALQKLLTGGAISPGQIVALLEGMGIEAAVEDVPEDRKGDAFERVARFSLEDGVEVKYFRAVASGGLRAEALVVLRGPDSNRAAQKVLDSQTGDSVPSFQSP